MDLTRNIISVSVIVPCFRCSETIERAIDSVLAQTYLPLEIFLIDDFSNDEDRTLNALNSIRAKTNSIPMRVLQTKSNDGPGTARNTGWDLAIGSYVAFLDSDDSWHPQKLEIQYRWMVAHPDAVLSGHQSALKTQGVENAVLPDNFELQWRQVSIGALLLRNVFPTRSVMLRREISTRFIPGKRNAEDYWLWLSIAFTRCPMWILKSPLAFSYKEDFGDGGLTGRLWRAELGELDTYKRLHQAGLISLPIWVAVSTFSFCKFVRRRLLVGIRNCFKRRSHE